MIFLIDFNSFVVGLTVGFLMNFFFIYVVVFKVLFKKKNCKDGNLSKEIYSDLDYHKKVTKKRKKRLKEFPKNVVDFLEKSLQPSSLINPDTNNSIATKHSKSDLTSNIPRSSSSPNLFNYSDEDNKNNPQLNRKFFSVEPLRSLINEKSETEKCEWLNLCFNRYFLILRKSVLFEIKMKKKLIKKVKNRLKSQSFVTDFDVFSIDLGDNPPQLQGWRIVKEVTDDLAVSFECDVKYSGGASVKLEVKSIAGSFPCIAEIKKLNGVLKFRLPSLSSPNKVSLQFLKPLPQESLIEFFIETEIVENFYIKEAIRKIIGKILILVFNELMVFPNFRSFFLPNLNPKQFNYWKKRKTEVFYEKTNGDKVKSNSQEEEVINFFEFDSEDLEGEEESDIDDANASSNDGDLKNDDAYEVDNINDKKIK